MEMGKFFHGGLGVGIAIEFFDREEGRLIVFESTGRGPYDR